MLFYILIFVLYYKFILLKNNLYLIFSLTSFLLSFFCLYKIYESILNLYIISNFFKLILLLIFIFILFAPFLYYIIKFKKYNLLIYVGLSILFLIIILILFLFIIKLINNDSNHCQSDSDCIFFNKECCPGFNLAYNKNYITTLQIEKFFECFLFNYGSCPNRVAPPFRIVREPYCNIDNKCSVKTNCDETCNIFKDSLISSNIMEQEYITSYFESSGCICENSNLVYN